MQEAAGIDYWSSEEPDLLKEGDGIAYIPIFHIEGRQPEANP
jgi:hypothetical protein